MTDSWPPSNGLCSPTVPRKDAVFQTPASIRINAPASLVFDIVLCTADYPQWNSFVPKVEILEQPDSSRDKSVMQTGSVMHFFVVMDSSKPDKFQETGLQVTDISTPDKPSEYLSPEDLADPSYTSDLSKVYRVSWKQHGGFASRGLKTERFHEIIILDEKECELRTWEVYGGLLAHTVKWMYKQTLIDKFQLWSDDLKKYAEKKAGEAA